jgi:hypothetical protein
VDSKPVLERFDDLSIWKQGDQRAPHKPLLVPTPSDVGKGGILATSLSTNSLRTSPPS